MARQEVDIGVEGNDGTGDSIRESFRKVNENFQELYAVFGAGGQISFTTLADTPEDLEANKILAVNATGTAIRYSEFGSDSDLNPNDTDSVTVDSISVPGKIILSTTFSAIVDDNVNPTLGNHLDAGGFGIAGVQVSETAATELNAQPGKAAGTNYTIDDLVITKGYADRRYITSGLPIRIADEPSSTDQYILTVESYVNGNLFITGHGYDSGSNGTAFVFQAEDNDPNNITSGTTYYIRYVTDDQLALYATAEQAATESQQEADDNKIVVTGSIANDDTHTLTDAGLDINLTGNFLSDVAVPRKSVTLRSGDDMEGPLYLHDHPGDLAGDGTPNGIDDLQAATKYYVDNTAYSSPEVLFVSTGGDDSMQGVPNGKEGTSNTYAYRTINAAAQRANELIATAPEEPGPYFQTLTHSAGENESTVISSGVENPVNPITSTVLRLNKDFIISEVTGYLKFTYPNFTYNVATCERDLGLIIDSLRLDAERGTNANYLSRQAAERYYSSVSGRIAITSQLKQTDDAFEFLGDIINDSILQNRLFNQQTISSIDKKSTDQSTGDVSPSVVRTTGNHGLTDGSLIIFDNMAGMVEIEGEFAYVKTIDESRFEIFADEDLTTPFDNENYTNFVSGEIGLRYQTKFKQNTTQPQVFDGSTGGSEPTGATSVRQNVALIQTIINNGIQAGTDLAFGSRYELEITNSTAGSIDQTNPENVDARPGKVIRGKRSGALGRIITYEEDTNSTTFYMNLLEPTQFEEGEELEMGNFVKAKQVTIRVETGIYEEDYPIKVGKNISIKGDEFRRCIVRPKRRVSQSPFARTYFYRDREFDDLTLLTTGTPFVNQVGETQGFFGFHYLQDNTKQKNVGLGPTDSNVVNLGKYNKAARIIDSNKEYIVDKTIQYINSKIADDDEALFPSSFIYNETKCRRDTGIIVDGIVKDLRQGGVEFALENQGEYYTGSVVGQEDETADAINNISNITALLLTGQDPGDGDEFVADLSEGIVETTWEAGKEYLQDTFVTDGTLFYRARVTHTSVAEDDEGSQLNPDRWLQVRGSVDLVGDLIDVIVFAFDADYNPPLRNDEMDVFLMDDATIIRNLTVQGHGGFMCVLDPIGQILTKSPYIQTASSFSKSKNEKTFAGGMYVDAFAGNIPMRVMNRDISNNPVPGNTGNYIDEAGTVALSPFVIAVESQDINGEPQGLKLRIPELPAPFYYEGQRYQVNAVSNYSSASGRAILYLDPSSNSGNGWIKSGTDDVGDPGHDADDAIQDIFLQTAGNRSILANDFTQINDLGYGLVTNNGAFSEQVSTFTYYCHAAYYANNGSEIRALNGSNGYGNFGLVAEGADPNEIPDQVTLANNMIQPVKAFTEAGYDNATEDTTITIYDVAIPPSANSILYIDHGGSVGGLNYIANRVENLADPNNDGTIGAAGAVVVTGINEINSSITGTVGADGTYNNVAQKSTSGSGTGAKFNIVITGGTATATIFNIGEGYAGSDTITLSGADLGGADGTNDLTITVDSIYGSTSGTISNYVYRVSIQEGTSNNDFFGNLQDDVTNDTLLELRGSESFTFSGVANQDIVERPSTAINFDEDDNTTYRSTSFTTSDDQNNELPSDGIKAVFDTEFDYVVTEIDSANTSVSAPSGGGTLGASASDTYIAVKRFPSENEFRILQDSTDSVNQNILLPGDGGYSGGMIFSFGGRSFRVKDYGPITTAPITSATQANPVTITSAGHGLSNGQFIEFSDVVGMTDLNDKRYYVGDVTTDTFNLYTNEDLNSTLNGTQFSPYESGGRWFTTNSVWYLEIEYIAGTDIEGNSAAGVKTTPTTDREIHLGLIAGSTAEITVAISLLRATGHDFTQIGTGGYNTTNYPSVLLGPPVGGNAAKAGFYSDEDNASKAQVWERRKGRVFFISSDNDGFFRVGKFFEVDQSTGSITFAGEVGISRAAKLGFKDGVTVDEFSNDELFTDNSDTAVPTEKAIANYVSRRLGHDGTAQLTGASRFEPGFLALNGSTPMEANLNMNSKQIKNLLDPVDDNDATTKDFVDQAVSNYDEFDDLRNVTIHNVAPADVSKQLVAPTGLQRVITTPENPGNFVVSGTITDGTAQGTVRALESRFDKVLNQNIRIITYELTTVANFNTTLSTITDGVVGSPGSNSAEVLEAPVDEITNAVESTDSDINIEIIRNANNTEIDLQIEDQAIINSDVNNDAKISQSKFMMKRAKTIASSTGLYGIDDDDTLGRTGQGNRGLAAFEADSFAEDVQLKFADPGQVTASAGDVIIQGSNRGYVVADITNSQTVVVRTADTFVTDNTQISLATVDGTGEEQTAVLLVDGADDPITLDSALNGYVRRSGYINLKDRGVDYSKLPELPTDTVIGRRQDGTGRSESVTFAQVVDEGFGLADGDFTNELAYGDPRNDPGKALIQTGTAGDGNYAYSEISYENENNSIAKRDNTGSIQATSYILGGDSEQVVLSESASTITFSTPAGGTILTSNGSSKPVINTGGKIKVGDIANVDESTFHGNSTFGTGQSAAEESAVATRWLYTSFIEAPDEKNAQGTGIGIGGGTGFGAGGADTIIFVTGGNVEAKVTTTGLEADDVRSISTNTNLTLSGNGTGSVIVADSLRVDGSITLNANLTNAIVYEGTADASETRLRFTNPTADRNITFPDASGTVAVSGGSSTTQSGLDLSVSAAGVISGSAEGLATTDSPTFAGLTVSGTNNLTTTRITTGAAATTGTVTGRWSLTTDSRFEATYADLGEYYQGDAEYEVGTVVVFGGEQEVTISTQHRDTRIAGVVSDQSAYTMNSECPGLKNLIALQGRVPVKVIGKVSKGDMLVASAIPGFAVVDNNPVIGSVIGKAVGEKLDTEKGIVEAVVGRV